MQTDIFQYFEPVTIGKSRIFASLVRDDGGGRLPPGQRLLSGQDGYKDHHATALPVPFLSCSTASSDGMNCHGK